MHRERFKSCYSGTDPVASSSSICLTRGVISHAGSALLRFDDFAPQLDQIAIERRAVQFFFLARDHDGGDAIANQVDERAAGAHEPLDSEQQRHAGDWNGGNDRESCDQSSKGCA